MRSGNKVLKDAARQYPRTSIPKVLGSARHTGDAYRIRMAHVGGLGHSSNEYHLNAPHQSAVNPAGVVVNVLRYVANGIAFQFNVTNKTNSVRTTSMVGMAKICRLTTVLAWCLQPDPTLRVWIYWERGMSPPQAHTKAMLVPRDETKQRHTNSCLHNNPIRSRYGNAMP